MQPRVTLAATVGGEMPVSGTAYYFRRPSLRARLLGATSLLCLALVLSDAAQAEPYERPGFYDRSFVALEGGYLFNGSDKNVDFHQTGFLSGLPALAPGHDGGMFGISFGRPIDPYWDWAFAWKYNSFGTANASTSENFASNQFAFQHFDFEFGYRPQTAGPVDVRFFGGLRVLNAHDRIHYGFDTTKLGTLDKLGNFDHKIDLWGAGPRGGFQATLPLGNSPAFLNLSGAASAIFTQETTRYDFSFSKATFGSPITGSGSSRTHNSPTVYNLEGSVAVGFRVSPTATFQIGYQAQQWWNLVTRIGDADDVGGFQPGRSNVLSHGPVAKITIALP